eukprot:scaffold8602_cov196-Amphora_coffeaeformis.AAC.3
MARINRSLAAASSRSGKLGSVAKTGLQWIFLMSIGALLFGAFNLNGKNYFQQQWSNNSLLLQEANVKTQPVVEQEQQQVVSCPPCPKPEPPPLAEPKKLTAEECRGARWGRNLKDFTGLTDGELDKRIRRKGRFHFEGEHEFWNPETSTELAWYYSTSVNYMFANAAHPLVPIVRELNVTDAPVLDFSGGVGNNVIYLASQGIKVRYFGIGMMEFALAEYRIRKRGLENLVAFIRPYSADTDWKFDPVKAALPRDGSLGAILALDVLEHIPDYHHVVKAMVDSIRVGGIIVEQSPFSEPKNDGKADVRVHVSDGGVSMAAAMGPRMKLRKKFFGTGGLWEKISE